MQKDISESFIDNKRIKLINELCGVSESNVIKNKIDECFNTFLPLLDSNTQRLLTFINEIDNILDKNDENVDLYSLSSKKVFVINNDEDLEIAVKNIKRSKIIGFDTEQKPIFKKGAKASKIAIIQIADKHNAYVFQIQQIKDISSLLSLLSSSKITKVGIGLKNDVNVLYTEFKINLNSYIDFGILFKSKLFYKNDLGAKKATLLFLNQKLQKSKNTSRSNWENKDLSSSQIKYAAEDAACVYDSFCEMLKQHEFLIKILPKYFQENYNKNMYINELNGVH